MHASHTQVAALHASRQGTFRVLHWVLDWAASERFELLNVTGRIQEAVRRPGIREGLVRLHSPHTATALSLKEWQEARRQDIRELFDQLVNRAANWRHNDRRYSDCDRGNADAYLHGLPLGQTLCLPVRDARLPLGFW